MLARRALKMAIKTAADMSTLSLLYKTKYLDKVLSGSKEPLPTLSTSLPTGNKSLNDRVAVHIGDITYLAVDAIVNAANEALLGGGGVDGAIHRAAGGGLYDECSELPVLHHTQRGNEVRCLPGSAKITDAYDLPCKKVIHAVGPRYTDPIYRRLPPDERQNRLTGCYKTSLDLAVANGCRTVAFSAISAGVFGYPSEDAARVAISTVHDYLGRTDSDKLELVIFVLFDPMNPYLPKDLPAYNKILPVYFPPTDETEGKADTATNAETSDQKAAETAEGVAQVERESPQTTSAEIGGETGESSNAEIDVEEEAEAELLAQSLPDVPQTNPASVVEGEQHTHVNKKPRREA